RSFGRVSGGLLRRASRTYPTRKRPASVSLPDSSELRTPRFAGIPLGIAVLASAGLFLLVPCKPLAAETVLRSSGSPLRPSRPSRAAARTEGRRATWAGSAFNSGRRRLRQTVYDGTGGPQAGFWPCGMDRWALLGSRKGKKTAEFFPGVTV